MPPKRITPKTAKGTTKKRRAAVEVGDQPKTPTPSRLRKTSKLPVLDNDYVDESDQCQNSEDEEVVITSTPVRDHSIATSTTYYAEPPAKCPKLDGNQGLTPLKPLSSILNFHLTFKSDVELARKESKDVLLRVNFHIRVAAWQSLEFNKELRANFVHAAFGIMKAQVLNMDVDDGRHIKGARALGLVVGEQIQKYSNMLMKNMRENFLCLLRILFENEGAQKMLETLLVGAETRGARAFNEHYSVIDQEEVNEIFIKNDVYLVADLWSPIIDLVEKDYLLTALD